MDTSVTGITLRYKNPNSAVPIAEHILSGKQEVWVNSSMWIPKIKY